MVKELRPIDRSDAVTSVRSVRVIRNPAAHSVCARSASIGPITPIAQRCDRGNVTEAVLVNKHGAVGIRQPVEALSGLAVFDSQEAGDRLLLEPFADIPLGRSGSGCDSREVHTPPSASAR